MKLKFGEKMLSFLLVLAMLVGFMPDIVSETELSANAAAPTITQGVYIRMGTYNGEDVDWFCYKINSTGIMMLSKYALKTSSFGSNSTYTKSNIYKWLDSDGGGTFENELGLTSAERALVRTVDLSGSYGDGTDRFIIPAYGNDELSRGSVNPITTYIYNKTATAGIVWLRSPRDDSNVRVAKSVDTAIVARYSGCAYGGRAVRPMFYLDLNAIQNLGFTGTGTENDPYVFEDRYDINSDFTTGGSFEATATRENSSIYKGEWKGSQNNKLVKDAAVTLTPKPTTGFRLGNISATKHMGSDVDAPFTPLSGTDGKDGEKFTNLVDKSTGTKWCLDFNSNDPPYIIIRANNMMTMKSYSLTTANDTAEYSGRNWKDWTIYGANFSSNADAVKDSPEWEVVTSVTNDSKLQATNYKQYDYTVDATTPYQYYMLKVTANQGADLIQMSEFKLRGDAFETIPLTQTNGNYSFTMPEANVDIHAEFEGDLHFVRKDVNDTWAEQTADKTTFTSASYKVTDEIANKYSAEHYVLKGYSTTYSAVGKYTAASVGQTLNLASSKGQLYLYYELERFDLAFYQDIAGTKIYKKENLPYGRPLNGYANETPAAQAHDTFAGWSESTNQSAYSDSALVNWSGQTMTAAKNVYPIWVHDKVNVKQNLNYEGSAAESSSLVDLDSTLTLETPTRNGYDFDGWYTQNGTKWDNSWSITPEFCDKDALGTTVVQTDSNHKYNYYTLTLTAHWKPKTVQIVYSLGDHAAVGSQPPANGSVEMDGTATLADAPNPNDAYLFKGWKIGNNTNLYSAGGSFTLSDWSVVTTDNDVNTITLTAEYVEKTQVKLFFNTNGGTAIEPITQYEGTEVDLSRYPTTRTGYTFNNWTVGEKTYNSNDVYSVTNENTIVTFDANWTVNQYTITFDSLGGSAVSSITQDYGTSITAPAEPTRDHYTFKGWYPVFPTTMPAKDTTLTAIWEPIKYTITFQSDGTTVPATEGVYGTAVNAPEEPTKEGYDFDGWRDSDNNPVTFPIYISGDATYTAAWKKKVSYTVTFKVVGGQWNDNTTDDKTVTLNGYEDDVLKLTAENIPAVGDVPDDHYKTGAWNTVPNTETQITENKTYTYTYAQKAQISATITFNVVNGSWNDETKADKTVTLSGYEGDVLKLTAADIPEVGAKPDANCSDGDWDVMPDTETEITEDKCYTYYYERMAVITEAPAARTLTYNKNAQELVTAGVADGGTIWYCISEASPEESASPESTIWSPQVPSETNAGKYKVWYIAVGDEGYVDTEIDFIEVSIEKGSPVAKYPTAKNQTYYSGTVQLINAGEVEKDCKIEYTLGTETTAGDTWETDATKITANKSGTFYVWYKVTGTENYEDVDATLITVKVSQGSTYSSQTWTLTMDSYEYDGTAHEPIINGRAYTYSSTQVQYTYYNADTNEELDGAPSAIGKYRVEVYADGGSSYYGRTQYATYSITDPIDANGMAKVDAFKENDTVPVSDGKIFAGWFTDETCTTAYTEDTGKAYAKFIDEKILTVKAQISSGTTANSEKTSIRFITSVDSLKYQNVGFKITFNGKTIDKQMTKVYTALNAGGKKISPKVFSEDSNYMEAYTLNNIPQSAFGKAFTVTPYYTTQDGTIVEGATNTFTIANRIK